MSTKGTIVQLHGGHTTWIKGKGPEEVWEELKTRSHATLAVGAHGQPAVINSAAVVALIPDYYK